MQKSGYADEQFGCGCVVVGGVVGFVGDTGAMGIVSVVLTQCDANAMSFVFSRESTFNFQRTFTEGAADAPGTRIVGSPPILIEACDVVAIAEGWDGFTAAPRL